MMNLKTIFHVVGTLVLTSFMTAAPAHEVSIADSGLDAAIRDALQIPNGRLTEQDLLRLINLDAGSRNVSNVEGLAGARNLQVLFLDSNRLTNSSPTCS